MYQCDSWLLLGRSDRTIETSDGVVVIRAEGGLEAFNAVNPGAVLSPITVWGRAVMVDLSGVDRLGPADLAGLVALVRWVRNQGSVVTVARANHAVVHVLNEVGIDRIAVVTELPPCPDRRRADCP